MDAIGNINELPVVNLAQIFEKLPWKDRLKIEQVCKNWQHVAKNFSWANYNVFDNLEYKDWPDTRAMQIKPFFERCGRHLRYLTLEKWSPQTVLSFIRMAPNVQHLRFCQVKLNDESLKELAGIVPGLKSLGMIRCKEISTDYSLGLMECFKAMTGLEYLSISEPYALFSRHSFVQFPSNLKYLDLCFVSNPAQILSWVAEGCKVLKGLCLYLCYDGDESLFHAISQIKSLTYLAMFTSLDWKTPYEIGYVFEELTELRALEINTLDEKYIKMYTQAPLDPEVLLEILRRCKSIRSVGLDFGPINSDFCSKICQAVDEIDEENRKQSAFTGITHPIVEVVQYYQKMDGNITAPYKWLRFKDDVSHSAVCEKWKFGWLGAGKPSLTFQGRRSGAPRPTTGLARRLRHLAMYMGQDMVSITGYSLAKYTGLFAAVFVSIDSALCGMYYLIMLSKRNTVESFNSDIMY
ncbi:F-box domain containing protein [Ditylenchus destructor]|uniref:F-box domain containing protein n=1 Tax=Ditylenchus destructor TaxID=166010 RepID=A0AAD4MV39_9BILA|nr:F-box domain containing protein [Ditylenchus destructor]